MAEVVIIHRRQASPLPSGPRLGLQENFHAQDVKSPPPQFSYESYANPQPNDYKPLRHGGRPPTTLRKLPPQAKQSKQVKQVKQVKDVKDIKEIKEVHPVKQTKPVKPVKQVNQGSSASQVSVHQTNPVKQVKQANQVSQASQVKQVNQVSSASQVSVHQTNPVKQVKQANQVSQASQVKQVNQINPLSRDYRLAVDWRKLSRPALGLVLDHLRDFHLSLSSTSCTTCYLRDLSALSLTCRSFTRPVQHRLYGSIQIVGRDSVHQLRCFGRKHGTRLILLRRTLRANPGLAEMVRRLHVPDPIVPWFLPGPHQDPNPEYEEYLNILASVVMSCPNLETFTGFYPFYNHKFDRLTHALSTRSRLTSHIWIIAENAEISKRARDRPPPGLLSPAQHREFRSYHKNWSRLRTLLLCSPGSAGVLEEHILLETIHCLPSLRNLGLSSFDADDVNDGTLIALPSTLKSLRLEENRGITDAGLTRWAASFVPSRLERLSLIHQGIDSLVTISKILSGLYRLRRFTIVQSDVLPALPPSNAVVYQPFLTSVQLQFLHWDVADPGAAQTFARGSGQRARRPENMKRLTVNEHLALSISHHGFPSLRYLRAPRDVSPPGALQSVCMKPENSNFLRPEDVFFMKSGQNPAISSNNLQVARVRAQRLINEAKAKVGRLDNEMPGQHELSAPSLPLRRRPVSTMMSPITTAATSPVLPAQPSFTPYSSPPPSSPRTARQTLIDQKSVPRDDENLSSASSGSSNPSLATTTGTTNSTCLTPEEAILPSTPIHSGHWPTVVQQIDQDGYRVGEGYGKDNGVNMIYRHQHQHQHQQQNQNQNQNRPGEQRNRSENLLPSLKSLSRTQGVVLSKFREEVDEALAFDPTQATQHATFRGDQNQPPASPGKKTEAGAGGAGVLSNKMRNCSVESWHPSLSSAHNSQHHRRGSSTSLKSAKSAKSQVRFWLHPDIPGRDANGGLVGWAELLRVAERQRAGQSWEQEKNQENGDNRGRARNVPGFVSSSAAPAAGGAAKKVVRVVTPTRTRTRSRSTSKGRTLVKNNVTIAMSKSIKDESVNSQHQQQQQQQQQQQRQRQHEGNDDDDAAEGWVKDGCDGGWKLNLVHRGVRDEGGLFQHQHQPQHYDQCGGGGGGGGGMTRGRGSEPVAARVSASISKRFSFAGINSGISELGARIRSRSRGRSRDRSQDRDENRTADAVDDVTNNTNANANANDANASANANENHDKNNDGNTSSGSSRRRRWSLTRRSSSTDRGQGRDHGQGESQGRGRSWTRTRSWSRSRNSSADGDINTSSSSFASTYSYSSGSGYGKTMPAWKHTFRERARGQREGRDVALVADLVFF